MDAEFEALIKVGKLISHGLALWCRGSATATAKQQRGSVRRNLTQLQAQIKQLEQVWQNPFQRQSAHDMSQQDQREVQADLDKHKKALEGKMAEQKQLHRDLKINQIQEITALIGTLSSTVALGAKVVQLTSDGTLTLASSVQCISGVGSIFAATAGAIGAYKAGKALSKDLALGQVLHNQLKDFESREKAIDDFLKGQDENTKTKMASLQTQATEAAKLAFSRKPDDHAKLATTLSDMQTQFAELETQWQTNNSNAYPNKQQLQQSMSYLFAKALLQEAQTANSHHVIQGIAVIVCALAIVAAAVALSVFSFGTAPAIAAVLIPSLQAAVFCCTLAKIWLQQRLQAERDQFKTAQEMLTKPITKLTTCPENDPSSAEKSENLQTVLQKAWARTSEKIQAHPDCKKNLKIIKLQREVLHLLQKVAPSHLQQQQILKTLRTLKKFMPVPPLQRKITDFGALYRAASAARGRSPSAKKRPDQTL